MGLLIPDSGNLEVDNIDISNSYRKKAARMEKLYSSCTTGYFYLRCNFFREYCLLNTKRLISKRFLSVQRKLKFLILFKKII